MKINNKFIAVLGAVGLWSMSAQGAHASEILYDSSGFLQGTQSFVQSFNIATPGTLTVSLTNVAWPEQLASLNLLMSSTSGALGPQMGAGSASYNVGAGDVFAQWFGTAQGPLNAGVYSLDIQFQPNSAGAPVPLPTSIALFLSGLGLLIWQRRGRGPTFGDATQRTPGVHDICTS